MPHSSTVDYYYVSLNNLVSKAQDATADYFIPFAYICRYMSGPEPKTATLEFLGRLKVWALELKAKMS